MTEYPHELSDYLDALARTYKEKYPDMPPVVKSILMGLTVQMWEAGLRFDATHDWYRPTPTGPDYNIGLINLAVNGTLDEYDVAWMKAMLT